MQLPDGREELVTFNLPMDVTVIAALTHAVSLAADRLGYTDVHASSGNRHRISIIGTPPARPALITPTSRITRTEEEAPNP